MGGKLFGKVLALAGLGLAVWLPAPASALPLQQGVAVLLGPFEAQRPDGDVAAGWEVRFADRRFSFLPARLPPLTPVAGLLATSEGAAYGYGGVRLDLPLGARWRLTPHWAAGFYTKAEGRNLGGELQFRSGVDLVWRVRGDTWLGLGFFHLSNARIYDRNPGTESLLLTFGTGLGGR